MSIFSDIESLEQEIQRLGSPRTIGELKDLIDKLPNETPFGFRNQPSQDLFEIKDTNQTHIVFQ
jgi:hypothetical protein